MHPYLTARLAEGTIADRLAEAERRRSARGDDTARPRKVGRIAGVRGFLARLAPSRNDASPIESCPAGCSLCL